MAYDLERALIRYTGFAGLRLNVMALSKFQAGVAKQVGGDVKTDAVWELLQRMVYALAPAAE